MIPPYTESDWVMFTVVAGGMSLGAGTGMALDILMMALRRGMEWSKPQKPQESQKDESQRDEAQKDESQKNDE